MRTISNSKEKLRLKENWLFGGIQFFYWSGFSALFSFLTLFLKKNAYTESQIGMLLAVLAFVSIISQPFWGFLSDRFKSEKVILIGALSVSSLAGFVLMISYEKMMVVLIVSMGLAITSNSMPTIIDHWIFSYMKSNPNIDYGMTRSMGSIGFAFNSILLGFLIDNTGYYIMFVAHFLFNFIAVLLCLSIKWEQEYKNNNPERKLQRKHAIIHVIRESREFILFLFASFFIFVGFRGTANFMPILLELRGGNNFALGLSLLIMSISEVPVLLFVNRSLKKIKDVHLIAFSMIIFVIRIGLHLVVSSLIGIILLQSLQALSFAIFLPASLFYITRIAPVHLRATYLTIASSVYMGLGTVVGSSIGGMIVKEYGIIKIYEAGTVAALLGVFIFLYSLNRLRNNGTNSKMKDQKKWIYSQ